MRLANSALPGFAESNAATSGGADFDPGWQAKLIQRGFD
jgi:hypothetical protein